MIFFTVFILSLLGTLFFSSCIRGFCIEHNLMDHPGERKIHKTPIPRLGGVGIFLSISLVLLVVFLVKSSLLREIRPQIGFVLLGGLTMVGLGVYDDLRTVKPGIKLVFQTIASLIVIIAGLRITFVRIPFHGVVDLGWSSYPLTLAWFLIIINAVNLVDGLDGLAAGISVIAAVSLLVVGYMLKVDVIILISSAIAGSCLGFLRYNYFPASMFMGDSGSLFLGYLFALLAVICPIKSYTSVALFVPLLALGVPLIEIAISSLRRFLGKQRLYLADKRHIFHFLMERGFSHRDTVWLFYLLSSVFAIMVIGLLTQSQRTAFFLVLLLILTFATIFVFWYNRSQTKSKLEKK